MQPAHHALVIGQDAHAQLADQRAVVMKKLADLETNLEAHRSDGDVDRLGDLGKVSGQQRGGGTGGNHLHSKGPQRHHTLHRQCRHQHSAGTPRHRRNLVQVVGNRVDAGRH